MFIRMSVHMSTVHTCRYACLPTYVYTCISTCLYICLFDALRACVQHMPTAHACSVRAARTHRRTRTRACMDARTHTNTHARTHARTGMQCVPPVQGRARAGMEQRQRRVSCGVGVPGLRANGCHLFSYNCNIFPSTLPLCTRTYSTVSPTPTFRAGTGF